VRSLLRSVVGSAPGLEVAATAADGQSALASIETLHPDLVLLDVEMPVMDGLVTLRKLRARGHRMPVIMCSSLTQRGGRVTIEALASGASDYVAKPAGQASREAAMQSLAKELIPKILALTSQLRITPAGRVRQTALLAPAPAIAKAQPPSWIPTVVAIGVSTGGPAALDQILPALPGNFPLPVLVVQHMPELFTALLAERLNGRCQLRVHEATDGGEVRPGNILIARGNWHMELHAAARTGYRSRCVSTRQLLKIIVDRQLTCCSARQQRPMAQAWWLWCSPEWGPDGLIGCRLLRGVGAGVVVQDEPTSAVWGMPGAVASAGLAQKILPLNAIIPEILRLSSRYPSEARELRESVV
jgi:two-component system chemotaxis response regulator CheB